jgi:CubicO group peptidase (beta-lactamase class C family)
MAMRLDHAARCFAIANSDSQSALSERFANQRTPTTSNTHAPLSLMEHKMITVPLAAKAGLLLALLAVASCETTHSSRGAPSSVQAALDAQIPALLGKYRIASVGVALIVEGRVVLERGYGEQSAGVSATPATLFNLASLTKPVTAEVLLRLVAAGQLSLDEPLSSHWVDPDVASDARHQQLTLRIALSHQTGLANWRGHRPDGKLAFTFAPGSAYGYSGEGYDYAARFAERKLGRNFEDLAQERLFAPLRMTSTSFSSREWMQGRLAVPLDADGRWGEPQVEGSGQWNAANNLITTAGDYARFVASVMRSEALTPRLAAERLRPVRGPEPEWTCEVAPVTACPRALKVVLGWRRLEFADGPVFMHTGSNRRPGGERTLAYFDPGRRRGVVILTSGEEGGRLYRDIAAIMDPGSPVSAYLVSQQ